MNEPTTSPATQQPGLRIPLWFALVIMVLALIVGALILARVAEPLYRMLFPPGVPVPGDVEEIEHAEPETDAEYWIYRTTLTGRDVAAFYEDEGGSCFYRSAPQATYGDFPETSYAVAHCAGKKDDFSWEVYISEGYSEREGPTIFRIYRYDELD